jgi:hypothetical protein
MENPKSQTASNDAEANPKLQIPRKFPMPNEERGASNPAFENWVLRFVWDLGLGAWDFE